MQRVLITGITGFAGSHLAEHFLPDHPGGEVFRPFRWRRRRGNLEGTQGTGRAPG